MLLFFCLLTLFFVIVFIVVIVQLLSHAWLFVTPWTVALQASLSSIISQSLLRFMSTESVMLSNHFIFCHPFLFFPFNLSQHHGLLQWVDCSHQVAIEASASVLPVNIQAWFPLGLTSLISLWSKGFSRVFSSSTIQKHQFFVARPSSWVNFHIHTLSMGKTIALTTHTFVSKVMALLLIC